MIKLLSHIFAHIVEKRNRRFDSGAYKTYKPAVPVISIGNISAGGTGKTPFVIMLASYLIEKGFNPAIVGRGYKRRSKGLLIVSDGKRILADPEMAGDEMFLTASILQCPVVVDDLKYKAALFTSERFNIDVIIVDDGFQHRKLHRDLDIVLVDEITINKPDLIPFGRLREPLSSLDRADIICLTSDKIGKDIIKQYLHKDASVFYSRVKPGKPYDLFPDRNDDKDEIFSNSGIAVTGIANPERFMSMICENGFTPLDHMRFPDHHNYNQADLSKIIENCFRKSCHTIFTTEKDAVKLINFQDIIKTNKIKCVVFPIFTMIEDNKEKFFSIITDTINKNKWNQE